MTSSQRMVRGAALLSLTIGFAWTCGFDGSLREFLSASFWLPFARQAAYFEKPNIRRMNAPFAGMDTSEGDAPLAKLRRAYQRMVRGESPSFEEVLSAARADRSLTPNEREEVELIAGKIQLRLAERVHDTELLQTARIELESFLRTARSSGFLSEARGWLARVYYLLGNQTAAGKIYLDELNRNNSNLSRETLLNSLQMTYGYDGGPELLANLEKYFDTPEHAAFAIQLVTNPHWHRGEEGEFERIDRLPQAYPQMKRLLEKHSRLLSSNRRSDSFALLAMRTALRAGDPPGARQIAEAIPSDAAVRSEPDFQWMLAASRFLSRDFAAAEAPLLTLFGSREASSSQRAAAAYALVGVYRKLDNISGQLRFALWLHTQSGRNAAYWSMPSGISDLSVYWCPSGWDLNLLLEAEASVEALQSFVSQYPGLPDMRLVKYALAVRLTRENRYQEAAELYQGIHALRRATRIRRMAELHYAANRTDLPAAQTLEAKYKLAEYIHDNPDRIYFNDSLWAGLQRYAFRGSTEIRLTRSQRDALIAAERKLKDDQEERWRAYQLLRDIVTDAGKTALGRRAALLARRSLRGISERFGRQQEIHAADVELTRWLRQ